MEKITLPSTKSESQKNEAQSQDTPQTETSSQSFDNVEINDSGYQSGFSDTSHFEKINVDDDFIEGENAQGLLTKDQFYEGFEGIFNLCSGATRLQTLAIHRGDKTARAASDAVYDTCKDVKMLRFLIEPSNVWLQRFIVIAAFGSMKVAAVSSELDARRTKDVTPNQDSQKKQNSSQRPKESPMAWTDNERQAGV